ncbi:UBR1 [Candida pseudojiufengensis]|uniref:UBR1 n=1 Tax=Candida pseudojiufengensis TaxID=497109 RepID=UPI00222438A8|nr:UBR1 [Candida pseudojiufengensis]KAI5965757.1 UBR1 [Candida pseudojiufengensis]
MSDENKDKLKRLLVNLPSQVEFKSSPSLYHGLFKILYISATSNGKHLSKLFPKLNPNDRDYIESLRNKDYDINDMEIIYKFHHQEYLMPSYSHPIEKPCARLFQPGDAVYRCEDCAYDDTCVLCMHCFNQMDHLSHTVVVYKSQGISGGVCDCGDPEAFVNPLHCRCATTEEDNSSMDITFESLYQTIKICLQYILDVTNSSVSTLPIIHDILSDPQSSLDEKSLSNYFLLPFGHYGGARDINSTDKWYLILWNDEYHDLGQAVRSIQLATGFNDSKATGIAQKIDKEGFCILKEGKTYTELLSSKSKVEQGGLVATITSARDHLREMIVKYIIQWFDEILNNNSKSFKNLSRDAITSLLIERDFCFSKVFPAEFLAGTTLHEEKKKKACYENGIPIDGKFLNMSGLPITEPLSRFQILLLYQIRFSKSIRKKLVSILIPIIVSNIELKSEFAKQFTEIYPTMLMIYTKSDREDQLNLISEITSQLYTCPLTMKILLRDLGAKYVLEGITRVVRENCAVKVNAHYVIKELPERTHHQRRLKGAVTRGIFDLLRFASNSLDLSSYMQPDNLSSLLSFLELFQGYLPFERKTGEHVEQESLNYRYHAIFSIPILIIVKNIASSSYPTEELEFAVKEVASKIVPLLTRVSESSMAFVHVLTSFFVYLLKNGGLKFAEKSKLMEIAQDSLRTIVLGSQVKVGFWIRNGYSVSTQASMYFGAGMSDCTFSNDFYLQQLFALYETPEQITQTFIRTWEFDEWFTNNKESVYEERFFSMVERFISFAYNIIVDRSAFSSMSSKESSIQAAKKYLTYQLCEKARKYSALKSNFNSEITGLEDFDDILLEIADYQAPSTLLDTGLYKLKEEVYLDLDPMSLFLDPSKFHVISDILIKTISKSKKIKEDQVIIEPRVIESPDEFVNKSIGNFAKTKTFFKLMYKLLRVAVDSSNETYLPHLLHLIHAIVLDDQLLHGNDYVNENFLHIPICDLLVSIVESKMSKPIVKKADYLVELMVKGDLRIIDNLVSCFGEEFIQSYKKRKTQIFESDDEKNKRKAEERKNKILKKYSKRQEKFLEKNKEYKEEAKDEEGLTDSSRTCVLCGEKESFDKVFGILCGTTQPAIFWPLYPVASKRASDIWSDDLYANEDDSKYGNQIQIQEPFVSRQRNVLSTCGHGIHYDCYRNSGGDSAYYQCSLCHNYYQYFLPSFAFNNLDEKSVIFKRPEDYKSERNTKIMNRGLVPPDHKVSFEIYKNIGKDQTSYATLINLLCNTIQMNEMTTRLNGVEGYSQFLKQIPKSNKVLMQSMIQGITLIPKFKSEGLDYDFDPVGIWQYHEDDVFNRTLYMFFISSRPLSDVIEQSMCQYIYSFFETALEEIDEEEFADEYVPNYDEDPVYKKFCETWWLLHQELVDENSGHYIYQMSQQLLSVYLRQLVIFKDVLLSSLIGDEVISHTNFSDLEDEIKNQKNIYGIDPLSKILQVPTFEEVLDFFSDEKFREHMSWLPDLLPLQFPGQIRLITLPKDHKDSLFAFPGYEVVKFVKCLLCGEDILPRSAHSECASDLVIAFDPKKNAFRVTLSLGTTSLAIELPGPYLTKHGEPKSIRYKGKATLDKFRFKELNKLWLNQGLASFVTRSSPGFMRALQNGALLNRAPVFTVPTNDMMDEDEDDDEEWMEEGEFMIF